MKKILVAVVLFLLLARAAADGAGRKIYTFGVLGFGGANQSGQIKSILEDLLKSVPLPDGARMKLLWFNSDEEFYKVIESRKLDFAFASWMDAVYRITKTGAYKPALTTTMFGMKKSSSCFYVRKDGKIKTLRDARNRKAAFIREMYSYFSVYKLMGTRPEDIFSHIEVPANTLSTPYTIALGTADIIMLGELTMKQMEMTNPGPVKNLQKLSCAEPHYASPVFYLKNTPDAVVKSVVDFARNWRRQKVFDKYRALITALKGEIVEATEKDFEPLIKFYDECIKKGWDKDYQWWEKARK